MSTELPFGAISSLYGLAHGIVTQAQKSVLIAAFIGLADKLRVASRPHRTTMKDYMLEILRKHVEELE